MAIDLSTLTVEELNELSFAAQARAQKVQAEEQRLEAEEENARDLRIANSVQVLTNLIGPAGAPPYNPGGTVPPSIRGMLAYTPEQFATYSGIAIQMLFQGLEVLSVTTRDIAEVLAEK